jgi:acyl dehydratase
MARMQTRIGSAPVEGRITDEALEAARAMVGQILRPEGPYLQDATPDTLRNFCNGIGDLNPLYRDLEHGRLSRYGTMLAHPNFPFAYGWPGRSRWGLPGVHGFYAGTDWELFRNVRPDDRVSCVERVVGVEEKESKFSGRLVLQYVEATYTNQRDELIARVLGWNSRHERQASRDAGKYKDITPYEYSPDELDKIDEAVLAEPEQIRGDKPRYWDEVAEGEEIQSIARGPLSLMDTMGFLVGNGRGHTHGVVAQAAAKHPAHYFRHGGAGIEYTGIGHHRDDVAKQVGVPGTYDYGPQRSSWMCSLVTNWMGDAAVLKRIRTELRRFNMVGDTTWCRGKVTRKYLKDGVPLVDLELKSENQRGDLTTTGLATVLLPARKVEMRPALDGTAVDLELPIIR